MPQVSGMQFQVATQVRPAALDGLGPAGGLPLPQSQLWVEAMRSHLREVFLKEVNNMWLTIDYRRGYLYVNGQQAERTFVIRMAFRSIRRVKVSSSEACT